MSGLWLLSVSLAVVAVCQTDARLPGVQARVTKNGIDYANSLASKLIPEEVKKVKIPTISGKTSAIDYIVTNVKIESLSIPDKTILTLNPANNGLTLTLTKVDVKASADWDVHVHEGIIRLHETGSIDVSLGGMHLQVTVKVGATAKEKVTVSAGSCSSGVSTIDLDFHGGAAIIIDLFKSLIEKDIKQFMNAQLCQLIEQKVNVDATKFLNNFNMSATILNKFVVDFGLTQSPNITASHLEAYAKGEVFWVKDKTEAPYSPKPFTKVASDASMVYLWLSQYTLTTAANVAQRHDFLQYNLTAADVPKSAQSYFNTTCPHLCIGKLIHQIGDKYPNVKVQIGLVSTATPNVTVSSSGITSDAKGNVTLYAQTKGGKIVFLVTFAVSASASIQGSVKNGMLKGKITKYNYDFTITKSDIGSIDAATLKSDIDRILAIAVPKLNAITENGIAIPEIENVGLAKTTMSFYDESVLISTDVKYNEKSRHVHTSQTEHHTLIGTFDQHLRKINVLPQIFTRLMSIAKEEMH